MNKTPIKLLTLCITCALFFIAKGCKNSDPFKNTGKIEDEQTLKPVTRSGELAWDYPVRPGMEAWNQFKTVDDMFEACQIPNDILKQLDTEFLVDICLNFPSPPLFPIYNNPQHGFNEYYNNFNGIQELFQRKDAGKYLLQKYSSMSFSEFDPLCELHQQGKFINHYKFVESILSQPQVMSSLGSDGRKALLQETILKMEEKLSNTDLFSGFNLEINLWVIVRVLYSEDKSLLQGLNQKNLQMAMETGMFVDIDVDIIYQLAKSMTYENK